MRFDLFYSIFSIYFVHISRSRCCSIFPSLNCSCFQSNVGLNFSSRNSIYSHLYCQLKSFDEKTFRSSFGSDYFLQRSFRSISIEFFIDEPIEVSSNQFDSFSSLFSDENEVEISLRFAGFPQIRFHSQSISSTLFPRNHAKKSLNLYLIPSTIDSINGTENSEQIIFSSDCFSNLTLSQMKLYIYTRDENFLPKLTFEEIFNNTNINQLDFYGSIISPSLSFTKKSFTGLIQSLTVHRRVDSVDANSFPFYSNVLSYRIHSIGAHSINLTSFVPLYQNFNALELIQPRDEISIDQFIPTLDSLTLDVEYFHEKIVFAARHIRHLKLGSRLRQLDPKVFSPLFFRRLRHFDTSQVILSQLTPESRCYLIEYITKNLREQITLILPQRENLTECQCSQLYLLHLTSTMESTNETNCVQQCRFTDCRPIREYFHEKYPLYSNQTRSFSSPDQDSINIPEKTDHLLSIDFSSDSFDADLISYLDNHTKSDGTNEKESLHISWSTSMHNTTDPPANTSNVSVLENLQEYDETIWSLTPDHTPSIGSMNSEKMKYLLWLMILFAIVLVFLLIVLIFVVILLRYRRRYPSKSLPIDT